MCESCTASQSRTFPTKDMAEVKVFCGVYGEGSVFSVKIALDAKVSALQKAIFAKKRFSEQYKFDASALTLYLAQKKEGEESKWLKDDDNLDDLLRGGISNEYEEMRPSWKLTKAELLGPAFKPREEEIHVLVELRETEVPATGATLQAPWQESKVWYGVRGTVGGLQGVDPNDCRTLSRMALTEEIIQSVDEMHVLLVKSPPMTGKTALATLVSRDLANRITNRKELAKVFSFTALRVHEEETFSDIFQRQCGVD